MERCISFLCAYHIAKKKQKKDNIIKMVKEVPKVLSNTDSTRNLYANTSFAVYTN